MAGIPVFKNYLGGKWVAAASDATYENRNPACYDEVVGIFPQSGPEDVEHAVSVAAEAFSTWRLTPAPKRAEILFRAAEILVRRKEEFARQMTQEMGKVLLETIQVLEKQQPRRLLGVIQLRRASRLFPEDVIDVLEGLFKHRQQAPGRCSWEGRRKAYTGA